MTAGEAADENTSTARFREETHAALARLSVTVTPSTPVTLSEILNLSMRRIPPFVRPDDPTGFHDAVILLTAIHYAAAHHLGEIMFVSNDSRHSTSAVKEIGAQHAVQCELVPEIDVLTEMMKSLATVHLKSMHDTSVRLAPAFVTTHLSEIQAYLAAHPPAPSDFQGVSPPVTEVVAVGVQT